MQVDVIFLIHWYANFIFGQKDMLSLSKVTLLVHYILSAPIYFI
jgi:hypothetical protein